MSGETGDDDADTQPVGPAPHRSTLWRIIFVVIVVLGVAVTVVGGVTDAAATDLVSSGRAIGRT